MFPTGHGFISLITTAIIVLIFFPQYRTQLKPIIGAGFVFALLPDIDTLYPIVRTLSFFTYNAESITSLETISSKLWTFSKISHRGLTHSIPVGTSVSIFLYSFLLSMLNIKQENSNIKLPTTVQNTITIITGMILFTLTVFASTTPELILFILFICFTIVVGSILVHTYNFSPFVVFLTSLIGFTTHPIGDMWLGPQFNPFNPISIQLPRISITHFGSIWPILQFGLEALVTLVGTTIFVKYHYNMTLQEMIQTLYNIEHDGIFAIVVSLCIYITYTTYGLSILIKEYRTAILLLIIPVVVANSIQLQMNNRHNLLSITPLSALIISIVCLLMLIHVRILGQTSLIQLLMSF